MYIINISVYPVAILVYYHGCLAEMFGPKTGYFSGGLSYSNYFWGIFGWLSDKFRTTFGPFSDSFRTAFGLRGILGWLSDSFRTAFDCRKVFG